MDAIRTHAPLGTRVLLRHLRRRYDAGERWYFVGGRRGDPDDWDNYIPLINRIRQIEAINAAEEEAYANYLSMIVVPEVPVCEGGACRQN